MRILPLVLLGGVAALFAGSAQAAGTAPALLLEKLGQARFQVALTSLGDARVVYAFDGLPSGAASALSWVRAEQASGRVVLANADAVSELASGSTPLFSYAPERAKELLRDSSLVEVPRT